MNGWIDAWLTPCLWFMGVWSLKWAVLIAGLAICYVVRPPKSAAARLLWAQCVLLVGLALPFVPYFWSAPFFGEIAAGDTARTSASSSSITERPLDRSPTTAGRPVPIVRPSAPARESQKPERADTESEDTADLATPELAGRHAWPQAMAVSIALLWMIGFTALVARLAYGWFVVQRLRRSTTSIGDLYQQECAACRRELGVRRAVLLAAHASVDIPIFAGGRCPMILVPTSWASLPETSRRAILYHELTHASRRDDFAKLGEELVRAVFFFHPLVLWLLAVIDAAREEVCDAAVVNRGIAPRELARILLDCCRSTGTQRLRYGLRNQLSFFRARTVKRRIHLLTEGQEMSRWTLRPSRLAICGVLGFGIVLAAVVGGLGLRAGEPVTRIAKAESAVKEIKAPKATIAITGSCTNERGKPIVNGRIRLFRVDHSDKYVCRPGGRMKVTMTGATSDDKNPPSALTSSGGFGDPEKQRLLHETRTDAKGQFEVVGLPIDEGWRSQQDQVWVVVQAEGKGTEICNPVIGKNSNGKESVEPIKLRLRKSASLSGRITNREGEPVSGAVVSASDMNFLAKPVPGILCAMTDADGRYEINDLPPVDIEGYGPAVVQFGTVSCLSFVLTVERPDYAPGVAEYTEVPSTVDHVLDRPANLYGKVVFDESGEPAEKVSVRWAHENGLSDAVFTDAQGNYSIPRLLPGKLTVTAEREGWLTSSQELPLASGDHRVDFQLKSGGFIKGHVVDDATGSAPKFNRSMGATVQAYLKGQEPVYNAGFNYTVPCPTGWIYEDGSFSMCVEPGQNVIQFMNPDWQLIDADRWNQQGIEVANGQTAEIELRLVPRAGGWTSFLTQARTAEAKAKGEPVPPTPPPSPVDSLNLGNDEYEIAVKSYLNFPDEQLPKKPMKEHALLWMLDQTDGRSLAEVSRETIDGEDQITAIMFGINALDIGTEANGQLFYMEYSVFAHIDKFPHLGTLYMLGMPGDDKSLEPLRGNEHLQSLVLGWIKNITAAGIKNLATLSNLQMLGVMSFKLDDDSLAEIGRFPKLASLQFAGVISDAGIANLKGNSKLKAMAVMPLSGSKLTDESLRHAASMPNLEQLAFATLGGNTEFTDEGLKHLAGMTKLTSLAVSGQQITDAGLSHLSGLKNLKDLNVAGTSVTQKGIDDLQAQLPDLKVTGNELEKPKEVGGAK